MSDLEIITFGCRLNAYRVRSHARACQRREAVRRGDRQYLRGDGRGGAPGAAGDPPRAPRPSGCQDHRHRLRGADRSGPLRCHGRGRPRHRQSGEARSQHLRRAGHRRQRAGKGQRHHVGAGDRLASDRRLRRPRPRLCANPERLRPSLHVLRHPVRPRAVALGPGGRGGGASAPARREGLRRDRADGRRHHRLWQGPPRRDDARQAGALGAQTGAGTAAAAALVDQLGRG